jgi:hypothetical protein
MSDHVEILSDLYRRLLAGRPAADDVEAALEGVAGA